MIRPSAQPADALGGGGADGCTDQVGQLGRQAPNPCPVDLDQTDVVHLFSTQQTTNHRDTLQQPLIAQWLGHPGVARDVLVDRLARTERRPKPTGEHLGERGDGLSHYHRVVPLPGGIDDPEGQGGGLKGCAQP